MHPRLKTTAVASNLSCVVLGVFLGKHILQNMCLHVYMYAPQRYICMRCCCCRITSAISDSVQPHRQQPTRLPCPWDSPGKNTGVGCHFLLQHMKVKSEGEDAQSCPTLRYPRDCSLPGSSIHGIFQARVLEWGAIVFSDMYICM